MEQKEEIAQKLLLSIGDLDIAIRQRFFLQNVGINTVADVVRHTEADFGKKFSPGIVIKIKDLLTSMDLTFGMDVGAYIEEPPKESFLDKIVSTIIGGAIGDALGVPYEFKDRDTFKATDMIGGGTHNQPAGTWSDDTSLTLCLMENIVEGGDCDALMRKFSDWHKNGYMTPHGKCFDDGHTTYAAIKTFRKGTPASQCGQTKESDCGNGSLMRIAPVALMNIENYSLGSRIKNIEKYSAITHAHPRAVFGCILYSEYLRLVYFRKSKDVTGILCDMVYGYHFGEICKYQYKDTTYESELSHYKRILKGDIYKLKRDDIQSDGYVVHTLEAALWCFLKNDNFKDTVLEAVNLGGDTDTTAMVAGSMAGLFYGTEDNKGIPSDWCNLLVKFDSIERLCKKYETKLTQSTFTDQRNGRTYKTVKIDNRIWMAENFNYGDEGKYDFETAKKICPEGWHLPTKDEWQLLLFDDFASVFGFKALPDGSFWWSSTECDYDKDFVWSLSLTNDSKRYKEYNSYPSDKLSVRYVKD